MGYTLARIASPSNPVGVLADLAGAGVNVFAGSWTGGAGASAVELAVVDWLRGWMGLGTEAGGVLVSGGAVGTLTALAAAALTLRARVVPHVSPWTLVGQITCGRLVGPPVPARPG